MTIANLGAGGRVIKRIQRGVDNSTKRFTEKNDVYKYSSGSSQYWATSYDITIDEVDISKAICRVNTVNEAISQTSELPCRLVDATTLRVYGRTSPTASQNPSSGYEEHKMPLLWEVIEFA